MNIQDYEFKKLLDAYLQGRASVDEQKLLDQFFTSYKREALTEEDIDLDYDEIGQRLHTQLAQRVSIQKKRTLYQYVLPVAASITFIAIFLYFFLMQQRPEEVKPSTVATIEKTTSAGQKMTIKLPDGTTVKLNSRSKISFPEMFTEHNREVTLQGEAFFKVTHNPSAPFIVHTPQANTTVLGTSFNVQSREHKPTTVTLVEGKVNVEQVGSYDDAVMLQPNQQAIITEQQPINTIAVDVTKYIAWKDEVLTFEQTPINEVIGQLEDWYGVTIKIDNRALAKCRLTGRYASEPLENVLESFSFMLKGSYTMSGKDVEIKAKGCNGNL